MLAGCESHLANCISELLPISSGTTRLPRCWVGIPDDLVVYYVIFIFKFLRSLSASQLFAGLGSRFTYIYNSLYKDHLIFQGALSPISLVDWNPSRPKYIFRNNNQNMKPVCIPVVDLKGLKLILLCMFEWGIFFTVLC